MSISYFVLYRGQAADPNGFVERYREVHVPILETWPGIRGVTIHTPAAWEDPQSIRSSGLALMCQMTFDDREALSEALNSEGRVRAREDFLRFPRFDGEVLHQAMVSVRR